MKFPQPHHISWPKGRRKRLIIGAGVLLVVLAVIGYVLWSKHVWDGYKPVYSSWQHDIRSDINSANKLPVITPDEQATVIAAYKDIGQRIEKTNEHMCDVHPLVQWQTTFDTLRQMYDECQKATAGTVSFHRQLQKMIIHLTDDRALSQILKKIPQPDELIDDAWSAQIDAWDAAVIATKNLSVDEGYKSTQQVAIERMGSVKDAWREVMAAHQAADKQKFLAAQTALSIAYDGMNDIFVSSRERTEVLANGLQSQYVNLPR